MWDVWVAAVLTSIGILGLEWECEDRTQQVYSCGIHSRWF